MPNAPWLLAGLLIVAQFELRADEAVNFNRDVRPILSDRCFQCHGPDAGQRKGDLRLDQEAAVFAKRDGHAAVVPGKLNDSELWRRITSNDPDERMPPKEGGRPLTADQVGTLKRWIEQGAKWQKHWAFVPPERPTLTVENSGESAGRARSPIDLLVAERLKKERLTPAREADRLTLLRRVAFDLTGLPPTPAEINAFVNDDAPDAYERLVDRLLASPRHGEKMAIRWLDAARYADTSGYQSDGERHMWRWRDWVIEAFNANMPFDQFTIEQLAGDLLPNPTLEQRIATGFNRNHRANSEGGIIPEEYAVEYVVDRVETTCTVWLGLTMGCVRCHDHKFDPFTQRDFYGLYALFNNPAEKGRANKLGNSPPYIKAPTKAQSEKAQQLLEEMVRKQVKFSSEMTSQPEAWEATKPAIDSDWLPTRNLVLSIPFDAPGNQGLEGNVTLADGKQGTAAAFNGDQTLSAGNIADFGFLDKFVLSAWVKIEQGGGGTVISRMTDAPQGDGYQFAIVNGKLQLNLVKRWLDDALRVETEESITPGVWHHIAAEYDGSRLAKGVGLYVDGRVQKPHISIDELNQTFSTKEPLRIGCGGGPAARFKGLIDEVRIYGAGRVPYLIDILSTSETVAEILRMRRSERSPEQKAKLEQYFIANHASPDLKALHEQYVAAGDDWVKYTENLPTVMVMDESVFRPRSAHVLIRGQYDKPGELLSSRLLTSLLPAKREPEYPYPDFHRLDLAQWLIDPQNPLTARVTVNRYWQTYFGTGLVKTTEDFGSQGDQPVYPDVLDWLALEFSGGSSEPRVPNPESPSSLAWDVKRLQRLIVTSATYRQSSAAAPAVLQRDPENRLLARGPRVRLSAEMVRDQFLFASGLLVEELGGPSVKPRQPAGLWSELTGGDDYVPGKGADLVRRSLYTFWKRTIPPPALTTLDAPSREFCTVRESRTNTPLQALVLLNDQDYADAALGAAVKILGETASEGERLAYACRLILSRDPSGAERKLLDQSLAQHQQYYREHPAQAEERVTKNELVRTSDHPPADLAAWTAICSTLFNLDEAVTKE